MDLVYLGSIDEGWQRELGGRQGINPMNEMVVSPWRSVRRFERALDTIAIFVVVR